MKITSHAKIRKQQRGFSDFIISIILEHGRVGNAPGGASKVYFGRKEYQNIVGELKKVIQLMDKAKGGNIIIKDNCISTLYK